MLPRRPNSFVVVVSIINFSFTVMSQFSRISLFVFLGILVGFIIIYSFHVKYVYLNADGQKRAICLARALVKLHKEQESIPNDFLEEVGFFFSDKRGVPFELKVNGGSAIEIRYRPRSTWIFQSSEANSQELKIFWTDKMDDIRIESSIKLP
jgi:hypothetical protein